MRCIRHTCWCCQANSRDAIHGQVSNDITEIKYHTHKKKKMSKCQNIKDVVNLKSRQ